MPQLQRGEKAETLSPTHATSYTLVLPPWSSDSGLWELTDEGPVSPLGDRTGESLWLVHLTTQPPPHHQHQDPHQQSSQSFQPWSPTKAQSHHYQKTANFQLNKAGFFQDVLRPGSLPNKSKAGIFPISKVSSPQCKIPKHAVLPTGGHPTAFLAQVS